MAKGAIHYVKHLSEIQDHLTVDNVELSNLAKVAPNTISSLRRRKPAKKITRNKVKLALEARCREVHSTELEAELAKIESRAGHKLSLEDVFQSAEWHCVDLPGFLKANGLDWAIFETGGSSLNSKQIGQLKGGAYFTPYIRDRISACLATKTDVPASLFERQQNDDVIAAVIDET
ncbi:hypothetical protein [Brevundimonas sp.]|jgi:hypothetical protein|uniref:hypothetical protein n=1 Tax=Brevundimonas sp. TaxID=1871086 RepID=UPI002E1395BF|nr:hypothetical protein [Brevundimonas sp.]